MKKAVLSAIFLSCLSLYGNEDMQRGLDPLQQGDSCRGAFNCPGGPNLEEAYDASLSVSYLYWFAGQDGMDMATPGVFQPGTGLVVPANVQEVTIFQTFEYSSGCKVEFSRSFGSFDDWIVLLDYTNLRRQTNTLPITAQGSSLGTGALYFTSWFFQSSAATQAIASSQLNSTWQLDLDFLDGSVSRPYYQGKRWWVAPFAGLRAAWIHQSMEIAANGLVNVTPSLTPTVSHNESRSWALGPRAGCEARLLFGRGFRCQGNMGASLLFTQYTSVTHSEDAITFTYPVSYALMNYNCLRPMLETSLGLGWGQYVKDHRYRLDFSATYDFNYLWGQNMMRMLNDINIFGSNAAAGDLFLHGWTLTASLDF